MPERWKENDHQENLEKRRINKNTKNIKSYNETKCLCAYMNCWALNWPLYFIKRCFYAVFFASDLPSHIISYQKKIKMPCVHATEYTELHVKAYFERSYLKIQLYSAQSLPSIYLRSLECCFHLLFFLALYLRLYNSFLLPQYQIISLFIYFFSLFLGRTLSLLHSHDQV